MEARVDVEPLPSELNTSTCSLAFLEVGKDKLTIRYNGPAQHDNDVGSIQSNHPVPRRRLVYYFEITVREASGGSITLGFSDRSFKPGRHPGYEAHSYGYRGDTGRKHHPSLPARGEEYGPAFGPGDVVGAGMHLPRHEIFFTKNGQMLGTAFRNVTGHPLFPTIGLHSQGARVDVNFGRQPFQFDASGIEAAEQRQLASALSSTSVAAGEVHQLVRGYLLHYGYADSLAAFDEAAGMEVSAAAAAQAPAAVPDAGPSQQQRPVGGAGLLPLRAQLRGLVAAGDTAAAWRLLEQQASGLLAPGQGGSAFELRFHLCCQQYVELIRSGDVAGALGYAEGTLSALRGASPQHDDTLRDVVALIAYQQPEQSPLASLLSQARREATADIVNAAVLQWQAPAGSPPPQAALEVLLQQLTAAQQELHEMAGGDGPEFNLQEHLPRPASMAQQRQQAAAAAEEQGAAAVAEDQGAVAMAE